MSLLESEVKDSNFFRTVFYRSPIAFAFMWVGVLLTYPASVAIQAQTFGRYLVEGFSPLYKLDPSYETFVETGIGLLLLGKSLQLF